MSVDDNYIRVTYQDIHVLIGQTAEVIRTAFHPDLFVAIGGGGFFPARVLRTFLKSKGAKNIPIQAIGLSLYEELGTLEGKPTSQEKLGKEVVRTQWLDFSTLGNRPLLGRKILIVDEVDDSRTTLAYAVSELQKDVMKQWSKLSEAQRANIPKTEFAIFVVHNKKKLKAGTLPSDVQYFSGADIDDVWIDYPWEQADIIKHDQLAAAQKKRKLFSSS